MTKIYTSRDEMMQDLLSLPAAQRAEILQEEANRTLVATTGANTFIVCGQAVPASSPSAELADVFVGVLERANPKTGAPDGLGTFGGLSERISRVDFIGLSAQERKDLIGHKDDVVSDGNGKAVLIFDMDIIRANNVVREAKEELADLGVAGVSLDASMLELLPVKDIKDDSYIINVWNGNKPAAEVFAVTPYCHKIETDEFFIERIARLASASHASGEAKAFRKMNITEALRHFGKTLPDGTEDKAFNYKYPHEYLALWRIASEKLGRDYGKVTALATELGIDFAKLATKLNKTPDYIKETLLCESLPKPKNKVSVNTPKPPPKVQAKLSILEKAKQLLQ